MRSLRADLAAAAREARTEARAAGRVEHVDGARMRSRELLHEAEAAINDFRAEVRSELRERVSSGVLDPAAVELLRTGLRDLRREIAAALRDGS
jgi:hypothetical protein